MVCPIYVRLMLSLCAGAIVAGQARAAPEACPSPDPDLAMVISDMHEPSEEPPHGVATVWTSRSGRSYPTYAVKPRLAYGNKPPAKFTAIQGWGQVFAAASGSAAEHTLIQVRDFRTYIFDKQTRRWSLLQQSGDVRGRAFAEDFHSAPPVAADIRSSSDDGTTVGMIPGRNFHFWPSSGRKPFDRNRLGALFVRAQARLAGDGSGTEDSASANYVMSVGADYWTQANAAYKGDRISNGDAGIGRFKKLTDCWRTFTMTTAPAALLKQYPPPLD